MTTVILGLPELSAAQNQKYLTVNQTFNQLDFIVQATVFNVTTSVPPVSPSQGDRYIVGPAASGLWVGKENNIASWIGTSWIFLVPSEGWRCYDQGANLLLIFDSTVWVDFATAGGFVIATTLVDGSQLQLGVNATPDTTNRLSVASPKVLFNAETDDFELILNKILSSDDLVLSYQTNFSTRTQMGSFGNDSFTIKVSPDGIAFFDGAIFDGANGNAALQRVKVVDGTQALPSYSFSSDTNTGLFSGGADNLTVSIAGTGLLQFRTTGIQALVSGSAGSAFYSWNGDTNTGMYRPAADELGLSAGGNEIFKLTATQAIITSAAPLFNHAGTDVLVVYNKNAVGDDAGFTMQTNFSTRVLVGLLANDDFTF